jgi:hypothetical protein
LDSSISDDIDFDVEETPCKKFLAAADATTAEGLPKEEQRCGLPNQSPLSRKCRLAPDAAQPEN